MNLFSDAGVARLHDRDYFDVVLAAAESSTRRIYASIFLFDLRPSQDVRGSVLELATVLAERRALGVDVRVILNGHARTPELGVANVATGVFLHAHQVPYRFAHRVHDNRAGSHAKFAVLDDLAVVGSQNWTDDGFHDNIEDAVLLSGGAADRLEDGFLRVWALGRGLPVTDHA